MPTMADVAKRASVALSTVSYAINGTRPISEETRQRIFAAMEEPGYKPNAMACGLASKRTRILALLFPTLERGLGITKLEFVTAAETAKETATTSSSGPRNSRISMNSAISLSRGGWTAWSLWKST